MSTRAASEKMRDMQEMFLEKQAKEMNIPVYSRESLVQYIMIGRPVGSFLAAVLCNDLRGAVQQADDDNRKILVEYVRFLTGCAPYNCWGSPALVQEWIKRGGKYPQRQPLHQEESK